MCNPVTILQTHSCNASTPLALPPLPHYNLPHHLFYHTLYGAEPLSQAAKITALRGVLLFLFLCIPAAEHIWRCMSNGEYSHPPSLSHFFLSESLLPPPSLSFLLLCNEQGRGGEECADLHVWRTGVRGRDCCSGPLVTNSAPSGPCLWGREGEWRQEMIWAGTEKTDREMSAYHKAEAFYEIWYREQTQTTAYLVSMATTTWPL